MYGTLTKKNYIRGNIISDGYGFQDKYQLSCQMPTLSFTYVAN